MELNDLLMLVLTCLNLVLVSFVSIHSIIDGNRGKITRGKKVWLNTEVLSRTKIDEHIKKLEEHLSSDTNIVDKCGLLDHDMLVFFYDSIDYIRMIEPKKYDEIKNNIMLAFDELMLMIIQTNNNLNDDEVKKAVKSYRIKLIKNLFELGIEIDKKM